LFLTPLAVLLGARAIWSRPDAPPACSDPAAVLFHDYTYLIGSANFGDPDGDPEAGSSFRWLVNGTPSPAEPVAESLLLRFDGSVEGANGELPTLSQNLAYAAGKWDQALALPPESQLKFARQNNLALQEGTIELWVALRAHGDDPVYRGQRHVLFQYRAPGGDNLLIAQGGDDGILYGGGVVNGEWQSAFSSSATMRGWQAGEWHHLALTYSASGNFMRFYVDGVLAADTSAGHYWPPAEDGTEFTIGGDIWDGVAYYLLDQVRLSGRAASGEEIAARARRIESPQANEVWLSTAELTVGDSVAFAYTPATGAETGTPCQSDPLVYPGIPLADPRPPSTLLPPGATEFELSVHSLEPTACAYAVGEPLAYPQMVPFDQGSGSTAHHTAVSGLNPDSNTLNDVYVRCAAQPDYLLHLQVRCLSPSNPPFPRTGNLWGWWKYLSAHDLPYLARIDLWLGAAARADQIRQLRQLNPDIRILVSINATGNNDIPGDDYYLKDIHGNSIEVWPGAYRLNLTRPEVAEYQAQYAYQAVLDTGLMADGVFFDNVMTTQSWLTEDMYGNPVQIDADQDGIADEPQEFDAAWNAGVFHELETFRQLMPHAIILGHSMNIYEPGIGELFDGISLGFWTADVLEGQEPFASLWQLVHDWHEMARQPAAVMVESSPQDQIAYGYDYSPWEKIPPSTLAFARTYYPYVRFGLALSLMNDGYFAHEFGDTWHGNDWWYDELDFDLGYPLGPAERVDQDFDPGPNLIEHGGFEQEIDPFWNFRADSEEGCEAIVTRDTADAAVGTASARTVITATSGTDWHIALEQDDRALEQGAIYDLSFWAKSDTARNITLSLKKGNPDWRNYGLWQRLPIGTQWQEYTVSFEANETAADARVQFMVGEITGTVWLDDVRLTLHPPDLYQRAYTNGLVLLNGTSNEQQIDLAPGYLRLKGSQAPLYEFIVDDSSQAFTTTGGAWLEKSYDSGGLKASGPFYHDWGQGLHELAGAAGEARWRLPLADTGTYTITAWWPAAPEAATWSQNVRYEVVAGGQSVVATNLDQSSGGDQWHLVAEVPLSPGDDPYLRVVCSGSAPCVADALHIRSSARYNNGAPAQRVILQPLDGIVLQRAWTVYLPLVLRHSGP